MTFGGSTTKDFCDDCNCCLSVVGQFSLGDAIDFGPQESVQALEYFAKKSPVPQSKGALSTLFDAARSQGIADICDECDCCIVSNNGIQIDTLRVDSGNIQSKYMLMGQ